MTEQETVHEEVQTDNDSTNAPGEDIGFTIDRSPSGAWERQEETARTAPSTLVSDARRYRKRAQTAEKEVGELKANLAAREKTLQEQEQAIATLQTSKHIDTLLHEAGAIDREAAHALIDQVLQTMEKTDVAQAVDDLRRSKPYLFRQGGRSRPSGSGAMCAQESAGESVRSSAVEHAAEAALESGKRIDLLRYLRLRRRR